MELLTISEAAELLKVSRQAVVKAIHEGRIEAARFGKRYRINKQWLEEYIKKGGDKTNE